LKILIVDDDPGTLNAVKVGLMSKGHDALIAGSGEEALKIIKARQANAEPLDMLLTDLKMPGMDGLKLIRAARKIMPDIKAILMTAYGDDNVKKKTRALRQCGYMDKPFRPEALIKMILTLEMSGDIKRAKKHTQCPGRQGE
jgi:CheY-like chemotaxis protein